ncbi:MAG: IclR family transcriptional regulator [Candidatus Rokuibacteriota bacterium]
MTNATQSVRRAAAILKAFGPERRTLGVTQLAATVGLHKSTAHRLASTLEGEGLLKQDLETGRYSLGDVLHRIASSFVEGDPLLRHGRPVLRTLSQSVGHTVSLAVLDQDEALFIMVIEGTLPIRATVARSGERLPLTVTAAGKVLLADLPRRDLTAILKRRGLRRLTPKSLTSRHALELELRRVKREGIGWSREECAVGLLSLAVPVRIGRTVAALSIACPTNLVKSSHTVSDLIRSLRDAAARLVAALEGAGEVRA